MHNIRLVYIATIFLRNTLEKVMQAAKVDTKTSGELLSLLNQRITEIKTTHNIPDTLMNEVRGNPPLHSYRDDHIEMGRISTYTMDNKSIALNEKPTNRERDLIDLGNGEGRITLGSYYREGDKFKFRPIYTKSPGDEGDPSNNYNDIALSYINGYKMIVDKYTQKENDGFGTIYKHVYGTMCLVEGRDVFLAGILLALKKIGIDIIQYLEWELFR